jgi:DNA-binding winged helix-turn-helix (wHTH) protein
MQEIKHLSSPVCFGIFELDLQSGELRRQGFRIKLQEQPLQVLVVLLERAGGVVTREELQEQLWPADTFVDFERGLNRAISKIREALADSADSPRFIETLPRRGYRFVAEVSTVSQLGVPEEESLNGPPIPPMLVQRGDGVDSGRVEVRQEHNAVGQAVSAQSGNLDRNRWALLAAGLVLLAVVGWLTAPWFRPTGPPVIVLMDTSAPMGVYDPTTRKKSGTNADDISNVLRDLPVALHKETVGSAWDREDQVLKQIPDLIVIHLSAFFHAMALDFQVGYPPFDDTESTRSRDLFVHLLAAAQNRLEAFLGYTGLANPKTRFLIYSRGRPGEWAEAAYQRDWVQNTERRFPVLKGRVFTLNVEGGANARFHDSRTVVQLRRSVESILGLTSSRAAK